MRYENITEGIFLKRPNRFIAHVEIDKRVEVCHVKNTGRCRELLVPGTPVFLEKSSNPNRKTQYHVHTSWRQNCHTPFHQKMRSTTC